MPKSLSSSSSRRSQRQIAPVLLNGAMVVALSNLTIFLFSLFPIIPTDPTWRVNAIVNLISMITPLLLAMLLMALAAWLDKGNKVIRKKSDLLARSAQVLSVLYLLAIPMFLQAGIKVVQTKSEIILSQIAELKTIIKGVEAATNEQELRAYMASLRQAPTLPARFDVPYATIKARVQTNLTATINRALNDLDVQKQESMQLLIKDSARTLICCLLASAGFSLVASTGRRSFLPAGWLIRVLGMGDALQSRNGKGGNEDKELRKQAESDRVSEGNDQRHQGSSAS